MIERQRLRRASFLCLHTVANVACFRAGCDVPPPSLHRHFYGRAHNNFLDIAVLKWCMVFGDPKASHYAPSLVSDKTRYTNELLSHIGMSQDQFDDYVRQLRAVRDKFMAHLDDAISAPMPMLDVMIESSKFLLLYLRRNENKNGDLSDIPVPADAIYESCYSDAHLAYSGKPRVAYIGGLKPDNG